MPDKPEQACTEDYALLGVEPGASRQKVKKAYKSLVKLWHPDRFPQGSLAQREAEERFKLINNAYHRVLLDAPPSRPAEEESPERPPRAEKGGSPQEEESNSRQSDPSPSPVHRSSRAASHLLRRFRRWNRWTRSRTARSVLLLLLTFLVIHSVGMLPFSRWFHEGIAFLTPAKPQPPALDSTLQSLQVPPPLEASIESDPPLLQEPDLEPAPAPSDAPRPPEEVPRPPEEVPRQKEAGQVFFTLGSGEQEVLRIQGLPQRIYSQTWSYGISSITFKEGRVWSYNNFDGSLKVRLVPSDPGGACRPFFSLGASRDEVLRVQGTPTRIEGKDTWYYGFSEVRFRQDRVAGFNNFFNSLKIRMTPSGPNRQGPAQPYFTIGSSEDEVLALQGTPTSIQGNLWNYQFSDILFRDGRVRAVNNFSGNLLFVPPEDAFQSRRSDS